MLVLSALVVVVLFVFTLTSSVQVQQQLVCSSIQVKIDYESGISFLTTDDVISKVNESIDANVIGKPLSSLDLKYIEHSLEQCPFIAYATVYIDHANAIHAEVIQKRPILRVINNDGVGYYISDKGDKIPLCPTFTAHVPVAMGVVETHEDSYGDSIVLLQLFQWAEYLQRDTLIGSLIDHCYVQESGELELFTKFGYHSIEFGRADAEMGEKFEKLKTFYREGMTRVGWEKYSSINLKYKGQVVCVKRDGESIATAKKDKEPIAPTTDIPVETETEKPTN